MSSTAKERTFLEHRGLALQNARLAQRTPLASELEQKNRIDSMCQVDIPQRLDSSFPLDNMCLRDTAVEIQSCLFVPPKIVLLVSKMFLPDTVPASEFRRRREDLRGEEPLQYHDDSNVLLGTTPWVLRDRALYRRNRERKGRVSRRRSLGTKIQTGTACTRFLHRHLHTFQDDKDAASRSRSHYSTFLERMVSELLPTDRHFAFRECSNSQGDTGKFLGGRWPPRDTHNLRNKVEMFRNPRAN